MDVRIGDKCSGPEVQDIFRSLLRNAFLPGLKLLVLGLARLERATMQELACSSLLGNLKHLHLGNIQINDEGFQVILNESKRFSRLEQIGLGGMEIREETLQKLKDVFGSIIMEGSRVCGVIEP